MDGFVATVFDGHGGWQCSEWARSSLHAFLDEELSKFNTRTPTDDQVKAAINAAFDRVEDEFLRVAKEAYKLHYSTVCQTGSCCLSTVVINGKIYVANIGDCRGVLLTEKADGTYEGVKMNTNMSACSKKEQARLRKAFPKDDDIVFERSPTAWYVKRRLMPTRAFGDLHLKHQELCNPLNFPREYGFKGKITPWTGPYITHKPEIRVYEVSEATKGYVLASDGLWDEMKARDVAMKFSENPKVHPKKFIDRLMKEALEHAASVAGLTVDAMKGRK